MRNTYQQIKKNDIDLITISLFCPQYHLLNRESIENIWEYQKGLMLNDEKVDNLIYQILNNKKENKVCVSQS